MIGDPPEKAAREEEGEEMGFWFFLRRTAATAL